MARESEPIGEYLTSLDAGLQVMMMFAAADSINVTAVSDELGVSRSSAYRILNTLRHRGIVILGPTGRGYFPGPVLLDLARPRGLDAGDRHRLRPVIKEAVAITGETVHVATLIGTQILFFDGEEPDRPVRATLRQGYLRPAHAISAGKLLLSQLTDDQVQALYPIPELTKLTPWTIGSVPDLLAELATIRDTGHAFSKQETEVGLCGTAVALKGRSWRERVALCATVPHDRGDEESLLEVQRGLMEAAQRL
ncbi:IclR family transcriptional regulator [Gordonia sp. CPCC 206044]|uniref:IclR family transcriptional regulator n=1 Tax=Gordonia sp. CPCC 206044 TaxID=3140793 RepID=UPI003AF4085C